MALLSPSTGAPFVAARAVGARAARVPVVSALGQPGLLRLLPANRAPQALPHMLTGMAAGSPDGWQRSTGAAAALARTAGLVASVVLAVLLAVIAVAVSGCPARPPGSPWLLAIVVAAALWLAGQALGGMLTGGGTDPDSGPLLALLALAYWPARHRDDSARRVESVTT